MCNFGGRRRNGFEVIEGGISEASPQVTGIKKKPGLNRVNS